MKKISDLDQDHLKASPFECIEISVHKVSHAVGISGLVKLFSNARENELDS